MRVKCALVFPTINHIPASSSNKMRRDGIHVFDKYNRKLSCIKSNKLNKTVSCRESIVDKNLPVVVLLNDISHFWHMQWIARARESKLETSTMTRISSLLELRMQSVSWTYYFGCSFTLERSEWSNIGIPTLSLSLSTVWNWAMNFKLLDSLSLPPVDMPWIDIII